MAKTLLPIQGARVSPLVRDLDPMCCTFKKRILSVCSNYDMEQWTGSKLGNSKSRLYIVTLFI